MLLKTLIKWCNSTDEKPEERLESQYNIYFDILLIFFVVYRSTNII